ncbi:MAG: hypothetical protein EOM70_03180 [Clostridia bacterium]|nr:hypothetical protein [Clostridia bacterium]
MSGAPGLTAGPLDTGRFSRSFRILIAWTGVLLLVPGASYVALGSDAVAFLRWWFALLALGLLAWPLSQQLFGRVSLNLAYLPAKAIGLFLMSLLHWESGYLFHFGLTRTSLLMLFLLLFSLCWVWGFKTFFRRSVPHGLGNRLFSAALAELFFGSLLLGGAYLRSFKPALDSLEKFMNVAFINSILRSPGLPAADPWLAGETINYYYFGQYTYALLTRLTGLSTPVAYNLGMATLWAFGASLSLVLGAGMIHLALDAAFQRAAGSNSARLHPGSHAAWLLKAAGGLLSFLLVNVGGNGHAFFYSDHGPGQPVLAWLSAHEWPVGNFSQAYWFPNATRFIGYNPETADKTIHEFPVYSYLVSDLHAHVINLTIVLLFLLLLLNLFARATAAGKISRGNPISGANPFLLQNMGQEGRAALSQPEIWALGVCLAIFMMQNYWDFIIYLPVSVVVLLAGNALDLSNRGQGTVLLVTIRRTAFQILLLLALAFILTAPFQAYFEPMSSQIAFSAARTPLWQVLVLWGPHLLAGLAGSTALVVSRKARADFRPVDGLAIALFVYGGVLILAPELFYVVDIYSGDYKRANTMFKFTYQAFVLLGLAWAYFLVRLAQARSWRSLVILLLSGLLVMPGWFPGLATRQWYGDLARANQQGLDGLAPLGKKNSPQVAGEAANELSDDLLAINWLNTNIQGQPVILEAAGPSYTDTGRIATFTGLPTVIGWETHEWLWRTSQSQPSAYGDLVKPRQDDVRWIYTTTDQAQRLDLMTHYQVAYIVIGAIERSTYGDELQEEMLVSCGSVVFDSETLKIIRTGTP